jgi:lipoprotein-anchoring transpeptidase ErfK/SrfK
MGALFPYRMLTFAAALSFMWLSISDDRVHAMQRTTGATVSAAGVGQAMPVVQQRDGFWVEVVSQAVVRAGPTLNAPTVGTLEAGARVKVLSEDLDTDGDTTPWYRIDGGRYAGARIYAGRTNRLPAPQPSTTAPGESATGRWLVVNRKAATLTLVQDGQPEFTTYIALGRAGVDTPSGQYQIVNRLQFDDMRSDLNPTADRSYALPSVPHVQYFTREGDAVHGTYWHDKLGTQESQGCINLTMTDAAHLFERTAASTPLIILD